jgi:hypothetical protein
VPQETVPQETVPQETVPQETVPQETVPQETVPQETVPHETVPQGTMPQETVPQETVEYAQAPFRRSCDDAAAAVSSLRTDADVPEMPAIWRRAARTTIPARRGRYGVPHG